MFVVQLLLWPCVARRPRRGRRWRCGARLHSGRRGRRSQHADGKEIDVTEAVEKETETEVLGNKAGRDERVALASQQLSVPPKRQRAWNFFITRFVNLSLYVVCIIWMLHSLFALICCQVYNFEKQLKRAQSFASIVSKKKGKKDNFAATASILTDVVGGDLNKPSCAGAR